MPSFGSNSVLYSFLLNTPTISCTRSFARSLSTFLENHIYIASFVIVLQLSRSWNWKSPQLTTNLRWLRVFKVISLSWKERRVRACSWLRMFLLLKRSLFFVNDRLVIYKNWHLPVRSRLCGRRFRTIHSHQSGHDQRESFFAEIPSMQKSSADQIDISFQFCILHN